MAGGGVPDAAGDPAAQSVCMSLQLTSTDPAAETEFQDGSCAASSAPGWCYATGSAAHGCAQAVTFAPNALPSGAVAYLQCIEESISVVSGAAH